MTDKRIRKYAINILSIGVVKCIWQSYVSQSDPRELCRILYIEYMFWIKTSYYIKMNLLTLMAIDCCYFCFSNDRYR